MNDGHEIWMNIERGLKSRLEKSLDAHPWFPQERKETFEEVVAERDRLRAELERVRQCPRYYLYAVPMSIDDADIKIERDEDGEWVRVEDVFPEGSLR